MASQDSETRVLSEEAFRRALSDAAAAGTELDLTGRRVLLTSAVKVKRSEVLVIRGGTLVGECHSIFSIGTDRSGGLPSLTLVGTILEHTLMSSERKEIGAAVFVMGKARVVIQDATVSSRGGFALWLKHLASAEVTRTVVTSAGRTAIAAFNRATVSLEYFTTPYGAVESHVRPTRGYFRGDII